MAQNILIDTGFWFAYYTKGDQYYNRAQPKTKYIEQHNIVIPWPTLYETLNTAFTKRKDILSEFEKLLKKPTIQFIDDEPYREQAYLHTFETPKNHSLTDSVIREIIKDINVRIHGFITFNRNDFEDVVKRRKIDFI